MISKFGVGILLTIATLFIATPTNVFAATSSGNTAKVKKYFTQLKKLPNAAAPASKVNSLVKKLSKLNPKKANKYYRVGLTKLARTQANKAVADKLAADVAKILKKSGLPASQIKKIIKNVDKDEAAFTPTPTPYQAMLVEGAAIA